MGDSGSPKIPDIVTHVVKVPDKVPNDETQVHQVLEMGEMKDEHSLSMPFLLSFRNLTYSVKLGRKIPISWVFQDLHRIYTTAWIPPKATKRLYDTKVLLNDVSGEARDGEILAILGASGSGKTTLLDALANRIAKKSLGGTVTLNTEHLESRLLKAISTYVMQDDMLFPMLTVDETLAYAAEFRLPSTLSKLEKNRRVQDVINQLGLEHVTKTIIGDEGNRGVSGGERRRVSIGVEIISRPIILFLDEPTSGLDSTSAYMVMKILKRIAQNGSIVIMSIHQPSYRILDMIDHVLLLAQGHMVYSGPTKHLTSLFADFGHPISANVNWAEFSLDLIQELQDSPGGIHALIEFSKSWSEMKKSKKDANTNTSTEGPLSVKDAITLRGKSISALEMPTFANAFSTEVGILLRRSFLIFRRMPQTFLSFFVCVMLTGILLATIFPNVKASPIGVLERLGIFLYVLSTVYYSCGQALPGLVEERYKFMRETASNTYRRSSYVVSHAIFAMPSMAIVSLAFGAFTFWTLGLGGGLSGFYFYIIIIFASYWAGNSFVTFLSGFVKQATVGFILVIGVISYFLLYSGFFVSQQNIPIYMIWFHYISFVKYSYQATVQNEFQDPLKCFERGLQIFDNTPLSTAPDQMKEKAMEALQILSGSIGMNISSTTCLTTGADVLRQQGITGMSKWYSILIIVSYGFFFRFLFYITLLLGTKNRRK